MRTHAATSHKLRVRPMRTVQPLSSAHAGTVRNKERSPPPPPPPPQPTTDTNHKVQPVSTTRITTMSDLNGNDLQLLRKEFHAFWNAGLRGRDYLDQSVIVCYLDLDDEEVTLTRIFHCPEDGVDGACEEERAEDLLIDWFQEEMLLQKASNIEMSLYMNYSPLRLAAEGLVMVINDLETMGKKVKASLRFVELYKTGEGEEDAEENREGLRILQRRGVAVEVVKERDWLYLMQTLTRNSARGEQEEKNSAASQHLAEILRDPHDEETSTCDSEGNLQRVREADLISILQ